MPTEQHENTVSDLLTDESLLDVNDCLEMIHTATTPIRFRILYHLHTNGDASLKTLTDKLKFNKSALSANANLLMNAGLIRHWVDENDTNGSNMSYYELTATGEKITQTVIDYTDDYTNEDD